MSETYYWCSDTHSGPPDHPACDSTPGWDRRVLTLLNKGEKVILGGDILELGQFTMQQMLAQVWHVLCWLHRKGHVVRGNHDPLKWLPDHIIIGDTLFLHGHQADPWVHKLLGASITRAVGWLERWWPDVDERLSHCLQNLTLSGREVKDRHWRYVVRMARMAKKHGCSQVVFGHLHQLFGARCDGIRVICGGCCVNGRMNIIPIFVRRHEARSCVLSRPIPQGTKPHVPF